MNKDYNYTVDKQGQMKETMIKLFEEMKANILKSLENPDLSQLEIDKLLDSLIEVNKVIKRLNEN